MDFDDSGILITYINCLDCENPGDFITSISLDFDDPGDLIYLHCLDFDDPGDLIYLHCLDFDDPGDFAGDRHRAGSPAAADGDCASLGQVGSVLGLVQHLLTLAVFVHCDGDHFLL